MRDLTLWSLITLLGAGLGVAYFGGLWWTLRRAVTSARPGRWIVSSMVLRLSVAMPGIYLLSAGRWQRIVACLIGFFASRAAISWFLRPRFASSEVPHAAES